MSNEMLAEAFPSNLRACCAVSVASLCLCMLIPVGLLMGWPHPELLILAVFVCVLGFLGQLGLDGGV